MSTLDGTSRYSADDRYELASRAQSQQRRNHPTHLVVLGALVLVISLIVLVVAWQKDRTAHTSLLNKSAMLDTIKGEIATLDALERVAESSPRRAEFDKITDMISRQDAIAASVGLGDALGLPKTNSQKKGDATLNEYTYSVQDVSLEKMLAWVQAAVRQIPGLKISMIDVRPVNSSWSIKVTMYRFERIE